MENPDAYYRKKYWWRPWKKWLYLRKIRKGAKDMIKFIDYVREQVDYWNKARCEDCIDYYQSKSDAEKLLTGTCLINTMMMTNINNIMGFTSFATMDLYIMYEYLIKAKSDLEKNFFARLVCMNIYELTEDMTQLLGKDVDKDTGRGYGIRPIVDNLEDKELNEDLKELCSKWNLYRKEIDKGNKNFSGIRNITVAHKDHDFVKQYESMKGISWGQTIRDFEKFHGIFMKTKMFITKLMKVFDGKFKKEIKEVREIVRTSRKDVD